MLATFHDLSMNLSSEQLICCGGQNHLMLARNARTYDVMGTAQTRLAAGQPKDEPQILTRAHLTRLRSIGQANQANSEAG